MHGTCSAMSAASAVLPFSSALWREVQLALQGRMQGCACSAGLQAKLMHVLQHVWLLALPQQQSHICPSCLKTDLRLFELQMMSWVNTLALQIFLPMTVAGCAICEALSAAVFALMLSSFGCKIAFGLFLADYDVFAVLCMLLQTWRKRCGHSHRLQNVMENSFLAALSCCRHAGMGQCQTCPLVSCGPLAAIFFAMHAVLPVNLSQDRIQREATGGSSVSVSKFSTATLSNIPRGSGLFWWAVA